MGHPYGVQPEMGHPNDVRTRGLGAMSVLTDQDLLSILGCLPARDLAALQASSRALYVFASHEELWKALVLEELGGDWDFKGTWQETYLAARVPAAQRSAGPRVPRPVAGFYSDLLHQSWLCATLEPDPSWLEVENVDRRSGLTAEQFKIEYERPNRPVILTDAVSQWPAIKKWTRSYLAKVFRGKNVIVGDAPMDFGRYCRYAEQQTDELPLYLFDKSFLKTSPELESDFSVPEHFSEDLFSVLGAARPDHRWLIAGPAKSGSTWHQDPNQTCAWNACVTGVKKWVLYPPGCPPPGVAASADGADVACPVSVMEWFLSFYQLKEATGVAPLECLTRPGEVIFVPRGWWHCVLNLEESIAVTQNYVSSSNLGHVLAFLASPHADSLVSGVATAEERATLHDRFVAALQEQRPAVLEALEREKEERRKKAEADSKLASCFKACSDGEGGGGDGGDNGLTNGGSSGGFAFQFNFGK